MNEHDGIDTTAPLDPQGLPGFLIIGAMKSGTSSLHNLLAHHPRVFIPRGEVFFFDVDDFEQHPDFFPHGRRGWVTHDFEGDLPRYLDWYRGLFSGAEPGQLLGEDSTTYLASRLAPARVARLLPEAKLLVMLRDPVARAHSHYWHNVSRGRAIHTFEEALHQSSASYLTRGFYQEQLARWMGSCGPERLKVVFFEDFRDDPQAVLNGVLDFLGLERLVDVSEVSSHRNATRAPLHPPTRLLLNRLLSPIVARRYSSRVPGMPSYRPRSAQAELHRHPFWEGLEDWLDKALPARRPPPMAKDTRRALQGIFRKQNAGLSELLGEDVAARWPYMAGA
jgi:hypothetical protein